MSEKPALYRRSTAYFDSYSLSNHTRKTFGQLKRTVLKKTIFKYTCNSEVYAITKINQILNKKANANATYKEFLILIDEQEFLIQFYLINNVKLQFAFLVNVLSYLVKEYPNYLSFGKLYFVMLTNLLNKQKILNDTYERLIDDYKSKNKDSFENLFDSKFSDDENSSFYKDKFVQRYFNNKITDDSIDSIDSIEYLIWLIEKTGSGLIQTNDDLLNSPFRNKMSKQHSQKKRRSSLILILKKISFSERERERDSKVNKETIEDDEYKIFGFPGVKLVFKQSNTKIDSKRSWKKGANKTLNTIASSEIKNNTKTILIAKNTNSKFVKTSVFIDKLKKNTFRLKSYHSSTLIEKHCPMKTEPNIQMKKDKYSHNGIEKSGVFSGINISNNMIKVTLPSLRINQILNYSSQGGSKKNMSVNLKDSLYNSNNRICLTDKDDYYNDNNDRSRSMTNTKKLSSFTKGKRNSLFCQQLNALLRSSRNYSLKDSLDIPKSSTSSHNNRLYNC